MNWRPPLRGCHAPTRPRHSGWPDASFPAWPPWTPRPGSAVTEGATADLEDNLPSRDCPAAPPAVAEARRAHGRERARRAGLHGLPRPAPRQAALHEPARTLEQGSEAAGRRGRHLPLRGLDHQADRGRAAGAERRVAAAAPLHAGRGHGRADDAGDRARTGTDSTPGRLTDGRLKGARIYTSLTDGINLPKGLPFGDALGPELPPPRPGPAPHPNSGSSRPAPRSAR